MTEQETKPPMYWIKFKEMQVRAAESGLFCPRCQERRHLGSTTTPDVATKTYRCRTCNSSCLFRKK